MEPSSKSSRTHIRLLGCAAVLDPDRWSMIGGGRSKRLSLYMPISNVGANQGHGLKSKYMWTLTRNVNSNRFVWGCVCCGAR